jgi:hydroxymethylglutaryl-CoA synthase
VTVPRTNGETMGPGLSGIALYLPPYRVNLADWCQWTGNDREKIRLVVGDAFRLLGPRQSVYTMAANAVLRLIRQYGVDPRRVRYLALGTESSTDNSAGAVIVRGMVDEALLALGLPTLSRHCEVPEYKHACLGGIYALKGALRFVSSDADADAVAIVVCADKALYERGSSGEPTQGAGAVALLVEPEARLARVDLRESGSASSYRGLDFRKPLTVRLGTNGETGSLDIPVFNGRYSTNCYVEAVRSALQEMYSRRGLKAAAYLRGVEAVFLHRPYQRMPETGLGLAYLFALAAGSTAEHDELAALAQGAGLALPAVLAEMNTSADSARLAVSERIQDDLFPLSSAVLKVFRQSGSFQQVVRERTRLGQAPMRQMGNLYTAALPAWLAAGLTEAAAQRLPLAGREILTIGYGSGDAAEALPLHLVSNWEAAASRIDLAHAMASPIDLDLHQYIALREGETPAGLAVEPMGEFIVDKVGSRVDPAFQDRGIEYYRYVM